MNTTSEAAPIARQPEPPPGWRRARLGDVFKQDRQLVQPGSVLRYVGLEQVESITGRFLAATASAAEDGRSTTFRFGPSHVLYGKLRPYLNKVGLPDFEGRCTTELIPLLPSPEIGREFLAWMLRRNETVAAAMKGTTGSRMPRANMTELAQFEISLPPLAEQLRIAAVLRAKLAEVERARAALAAQLAAAESLPSAYLRAAFDHAQAKAWPRRELAHVAHLLPSTSVALAGDTELRVITTGCLTENSFRREGIKTSRMWGRDVEQALARPGEILIARSNTEDLVGRASIVPEDVERAAVSDLLHRVAPKAGSNAHFLCAWFSYLFLTGYWRLRAGGASSSMKKIGRSQLLRAEVPMPDVATQRRVAAALTGQLAAAAALRAGLAAQAADLARLPAAFLRDAFSGRL